MAINFYQAFVGQPVRTSAAGESPSGARGQSKDSAAPVSKTEAPKGEDVANKLGTMGPENGFEALAIAQSDPVQVTRAVEQANAVSESVFRARDRSVAFGYDEVSGRVTMTITEEINGKEVIHQIPPNDFLRMVERLKGYSDGDASPRGALIDMDI